MKNSYLEDISEIKALMNKSTKFISLSGLSGIMAGIYALIGAAYAYWLVNTYSNGYLILDGKIFNLILFDLFLVTLFSIGTAIYLSSKKAKKNNEKLWDAKSRRVILNFVIPLIAGAIYTFIILKQERYGQTGALMLLFYGLALINVSKYTYRDIRYLGFIEIILGLLSAYFEGFGFWFWVLGFGVLHIVYGIVMYYKYDRK